jgi:hypothetical protein
MDAFRPVGKQWVIETDKSGLDARLVAGPCGMHDALVHARSHRQLIADRPDLYPDRITFTVSARNLKDYGFSDDGSRIAN